MKNSHKFYINGEWVEPTNLKTLEVINPADESTLGTIALGDAKDVEKAVSAARNAFESFSNTSRDDRISLLEAIEDAYKPRFDEMAETISGISIKTRLGINHRKNVAACVSKDTQSDQVYKSPQPSITKLRPA